MPGRIDITGYDIQTQKGVHFLPIYEMYFERLVGWEIRLLELGIQLMEDVGTAFVDDWVDGKGYTPPSPPVTTPTTLHAKRAHYRWFSTLKPRVGRPVSACVAQSLPRSSKFMRLYGCTSPVGATRGPCRAAPMGQLGLSKN